MLSIINILRMARLATLTRHAELPVVVPRSHKMDLHVLFHGPFGVKRTLFKQGLKKAQVAGIEAIISGFDEYAANGLRTQLAYVLATAHHETGGRMQPVLETYASSREQAAKRLQRAFEKGQLKWVKNPYWHEDEGHHWVGAGLVQLTHKHNYRGPLRGAVMRRFDGADIGEDPNLLLDTKISVFVLIEGMMRGDTGVGDFTSDALEDHINERKTDYEEARRVVNPGDIPTYESIAVLAKMYERALREAGYPRS